MYSWSNMSRLKLKEKFVQKNVDFEINTWNPHVQGARIITNISISLVFSMFQTYIWVYYFNLHMSEKENSNLFLGSMSPIN
jgi:hypothetical protein